MSPTPDQTRQTLAFLQTVHPYDALDADALAQLAAKFYAKTLPAGTVIFAQGAPLEALYLIADGTVEITDVNGAIVSHLQARNHFGERGLLRDGTAATTAKAASDLQLFLLPATTFKSLLRDAPVVARYFNRTGSRGGQTSGLMTLHVADLMAQAPVSCPPEMSIRDCARLMRDNRVSSVGVVRGERLMGIVTVRDMTNKVVAGALDTARPVSEVMTADPVTLPPSALGSDVLHEMVEHGIAHLPVTEKGRFVGMITQTDLTRHQASSQAQMHADLSAARSVAALAEITARLPNLLMQLVGSHLAHDVVTRKISDVADLVTRRLIRMAQETLGPAPVPFCWAACGSQGRREQTGVSDQDNCLILHDSVTDDDLPYFEQLARSVCDGLNACGYVYCPGDMMASARRWRQPLAVWQGYFDQWITRPDGEAQLLASVMFDLRPIAGDARLFEALQSGPLEQAARNSIFVAHMTSNALTHVPPLSLLRGFATIRSGEHRNRLDMKMNGVVPVVDLGRIYALRGRLSAVNTRARIDAGIEAGVLSEAGGRDLLAAYDTIATARLEHQANLVQTGQTPDNFLAPSSLAAFERSHLRDAFVIVRTMQSALGASAAKR
ncbi:inosine 5'-monophosphate dehydrogenase [Aquimixticola soesokkakensis]|uniref:Inosine 5'-monophosphate dehydrogenase n=1 Tax=Aquimixticola soesokkakensis TaxID=1519096 RepID=A0A1Y5RKR7_9RHOB|nr:DUF294 nucleotidyltransferase-like domain-containing protein [Aquimixticola soesokkakensis]SLN19577.1 inosine 5'-monophosphate dehydrogenase [Aquimixticola soesokkakensis]